MRYPSRFLVPILLLSQLFLSQAAVAADWLYTVRPDDKLWTLTEKFCGTATRWRDVAAHNKISNPLDLQPGTQIRFPLEWLVEEPAVVRIVYARGDVRVERLIAAGDLAGALADDASLRGTELSVGAKIITGAFSYANVVFADGSGMQIGPDSEVQFDTLSAYRDTGMVDSRIRISRGSGTSRVERQEGPGSVYRISTPLGVAAVRGTEFRTRASNGASFVETVGGAVDYIAAAGTSNIERGFGLKASASGVAVEELLDAPAFTSAKASSPPTTAGQAQSTPRIYGSTESVIWQALTGAAGYLVQVYSGPDLAQILTQETVPSVGYALASLEPGAYVLGVRGIAASGLQGFEATHALRVQIVLAAPVNVRVRQIRRNADLAVSWDAVEGATGYRVVATPLDGGQALVENTSSTQLQFSNLALGKYSVTVQASDADIQGDVSEPTPRRVRRAFNWGLGTVLLAIGLVI